MDAVSSGSNLEIEAQEEDADVSDFVQILLLKSYRFKRLTAALILLPASHCSS